MEPYTALVAVTDGHAWVGAVFHKADHRRREAGLEASGKGADRFKGRWPHLGKWNEQVEREKQIAGKAIRSRFGIVRRPLAIDLSRVAGERDPASIMKPVSDFVSSREPLASPRRSRVHDDDSPVAISNDAGLTAFERLIIYRCPQVLSDDLGTYILDATSSSI